jgi:Tol biopolymer transport system component
MGSLRRPSIAACGLLALLAISAPAQGAFPGKNGKIAFSSDRDMQDPDLCRYTACNSEIYAMNPDGTGIANLTNSSDLDTWPAWSADGKKIAFSNESAGTTQDAPLNLITMNADGTDVTPLTNYDRDSGQSAGYPAWSPDGTKIVFSGSAPASIKVISADGSGETILLPIVIQPQPVWSPDGTKIAFTGYETETRTGQIYSVNADGTGLARLTDPPRDAFDPDWSPDGTKIAFTSYETGNWDISTMNADGSGRTGRFQRSCAGWVPRLVSRRDQARVPANCGTVQLRDLHDERRRHRPDERD